MTYYKFFRVTHKWLGIIFAIAFLNIAVTGFLLLEKKNLTWIQPETKQGGGNNTAPFITNPRLFQAVFAQNHNDFQTLDDIDRVDFRPHKRIFKVRSKKNHAEMQVDATTGDILSVAKRRSDLIESLHDGSFFGGLVYRLMMPMVAAAMLYLTLTGLYLWLAPIIKRRTK
ncbi:MAG: PepSY domain-containing protein [Planctomycetota bacterium]